MLSRCTVLIAAQALLPALTERMSANSAEILAFPDTDALRALETILTRRPDTVALEQGFAAAPRGAALINRIAADPSLAGAAVRVVAHDWLGAAPADEAEVPDSPVGSERVDQQGTRRAPRVQLAGRIDASIDGNPASLIDLSTLGAQVVSPTSLRPNQRVRLSLSDGKSTIRMSGAIVWATFEIPPGSGPRYRAGIEFVSPDVAAIDGFCRIHRT